MDIFFFNQRVKSFQITTWFNKPFIVNPLQCARYGFINIDNDKIECCQCKTKKLLKSSFDNIKISSDVLEKRALEFCEELKTSHTPQCVFYNQPSPLRFTLFSHQDTSSGKNSNITKIHCFEFHDLMKKFRKINKSLHINLPMDPTFVNEYFTKHSLLINRILDQMHVEDAEERELYTTFCWLSIFNWQILNNADLPTLSCRHCQMTHYLKVKNNCLTSTESLHPHSMHRWWCPCVHINKLVVDYEQIVEKEDQSYIKSLTKRQLNEEAGWKQMLDSISTGLSSESELTHIHKDSLENEFNAATLVKNILANSISSVFETEKKRKDHLKSVYDKVYYKNEQVTNESSTVENIILIENNQIVSEKPASEITIIHDLPLLSNSNGVSITPKETNQTLLMDTSDDDIEIDNSEIIIETSEKIQPAHSPPKHILHQTTLDNYFHPSETLQPNDNNQPTEEELVTEAEQPINVPSTDAAEKPITTEMGDDNLMIDTEIIPNIDTTTITRNDSPPEEKVLSNITPPTPEVESTTADLSTPLSASGLSEFEEKTPKKMDSTNIHTSSKTPFESSITSPLSSTSDIVSPSVFKGTTPSSESKQEAKSETKPKPQQPKPQTPSKSNSDEKPKSKNVAPSPSTNKSSSKEETQSTHKPYKSRESSSTQNRKPSQPRKPREASSSNSNSTESSSSKKPAQTNDRSTRSSEQNKRKKPSGYQTSNPKTKNNKR
ncbi:predicted protein [Naegleria gruberi]|uniref:Predicted protein n=1 Tax=Naegleria gruberi TaxID=5762 RepID=D2VCG8_NAEGR|nr:uncharacterized protein NAEGRDRAFT_66566 [Naegleria gruberi]EFC45305.1 predicted protein [Naegleria gruberi]|eukprot:XP_002678049.1 predicted protein [Naegleria gruberi strain NEG-M]